MLRSIRTTHQICVWVGICLLYIMLAALLGSCSSQTQLRSWRDPKFGSGGFKNVFVLMRHDDLTIRQHFEEAVAAKFTENGISAISSLQVISPTDRRTREQLESSFDSLGIDAILIIRQTGESELQEYVPETTYFSLRKHVQ